MDALISSLAALLFWRPKDLADVHRAAHEVNNLLQLLQVRLARWALPRMSTWAHRRVALI